MFPDNRSLIKAKVEIISTILKIELNSKSSVTQGCHKERIEVDGEAR